MRVGIRISARDSEQWDVSITWDGRPKPLERRMRRLDQRPWVAPADDAALAACGAHDWAAMSHRVHSIGDVDDDDPRLLGRLLFAALFGSDWDAVFEAGAAAGGVLELALGCSGEARPLHGLAWELMHDDSGFVAIKCRPEVAIVRVVERDPKADSSLRAIDSPPRVLFAIGTSLRDPEIRPGAEFMGLMRRLESEGGSIVPYVLERAAPTRLTAAATRFRPDLVHVISHGRINAEREGELLLTEHDVPEPADWRTAGTLLDALRAAGPLPPIVVLSACQSGTAGGPHASTLAAEVVEGGVSTVIAMSGKVTDRACRLFTRKLGQVLVEGEPLVSAVALARRAAYLDAGPPARSVDWALPAVFQSADVPHGYRPVKVDPGTTGPLAAFKLGRAEPVFCGRREFLETCDELLAPGKDLEVLVVYTEGQRGLGKRRLLEELAIRALREGHVPCPVWPAKEDAPRTVRALALELLKAIRDARLRLGLPVDVHSSLLPLLARESDVRIEFPAGEDERWIELNLLIDALTADNRPLGAGGLRAAAAIDFGRLGADLRASGLSIATPESRPLVLLAGIEYWGEALEPLFQALLNEDGLGRPNDPVPVVVTCDLKSVGSDFLGIRKEQSERTEWIRFERLEPFAQDGEDSLAYRWILLNPRKRLDVPDAKYVYVAKHAEGEWLDEFRDFVRGVPGHMSSEMFYWSVRGLAKRGELERGDDDAVLQGYAQHQQGL
jgi:CHAT domain